MSHELRFQVEILPDLEWSALLERFRDVEALGFDLAVTADGYVDSMNPSRPWFDLWTLLAGAAQATGRIWIAPCVAQRWDFRKRGHIFLPLRGSNARKVQ